jgi:hypothetical protein
MIAEAPKPFKVEFLSPVKQRIRVLLVKAARGGVLTAFTSMVREAVQHLETDPVAWGDQMRTLPAAGLLDFHRLFQMISIRYAVNPTHRVVWVKEFTPVMNHPLAEP